MFSEIIFIILNLTIFLEFEVPTLSTGDTHRKTFEKTTAKFKSRALRKSAGNGGDCRQASRQGNELQKTFRHVSKYSLKKTIPPTRWFLNKMQDINFLHKKLLRNTQQGLLR